MQIALYKGPATEPMDRLIHWAVCVRTFSPYSHVEIVIGGVGPDGLSTCYSSSGRDGGVRVKRIDLANGHWDMLPWRADEAAVTDWFAKHDSAGYDYVGLLTFVLPWKLGSARKYFCSEALAAASGLSRPWAWTPGRMARYAKRQLATARDGLGRQVP